jgi:hypothetical protein
MPAIPTMFFSTPTHPHYNLHYGPEHSYRDSVSNLIPASAPFLEPRSLSPCREIWLTTPTVALLHGCVGCCLHSILILGSPWKMEEKPLERLGDHGAFCFFLGGGAWAIFGSWNPTITTRCKPASAKLRALTTYIVVTPLPKQCLRTGRWARHSASSHCWPQLRSLFCHGCLVLYFRIQGHLLHRQRLY